jgi:hypothetical protein
LDLLSKRQPKQLKPFRCPTKWSILIWGHKLSLNPFIIWVFRSMCSAGQGKRVYHFLKSCSTPLFGLVLLARKCKFGKFDSSLFPCWLH